MKNLDILAIGDIVIDAFIRLEKDEAQIVNDPKSGNALLAVQYGDKVPYESVTICNAVGNAGNAATSVARLGLHSAVLTHIGDDQDGKDCLEELERNNVDTAFVKTEEGKTTKTHYVLWYDVDRTILVKHDKFEYTLKDLIQGEVVPKWIYFSSVGQSPFNIYADIVAYLTAHPETKLAFQPATFDMQLGVEKLKDVYAHTETICVNVEEAQRILNETSRDLKTLLQGLANLGPKKVFITDGFDGAYAYEKSEIGEKFYFIPVYPHTPFERTGAGDAFFSTVVSALSLGKSVTESLTWGPINSMSVVQQIGAQKGLLSMEKLQEYLAKAPTEYMVKEI